MSSAMKIISWTIFLFLVVHVFYCQGQNRNIKLVAMNGNQYWFSSSSPYAPMLNFHLAYQYCRTLGLQLVTLETKEEVDSIAAYLKSVEGNAGKEYWTSGNKLGSEDSWIWMSSGEQLNATFSEYWLQQKHQGGSGIKQCMTMQAALNKGTVFTPEECARPLTFICEQLRCLYYNYPVTPFPDPDAEAEIAALRADLHVSSSSPSESRSIPLVHEEDALRIQNYLLNAGTEKVSDLNLPYALRRRITLRPSTSPILEMTTENSTTFFSSSSSADSSTTSSSSSPSSVSSSSFGVTEGKKELPVTTTSPMNSRLVKTTSTDVWTSPVSPDLSYVTVKNVVVSKSEKVSYSSNYSNINGLPSSLGQRTYQINRASSSPINNNPSDFLINIPVDTTGAFPSNIRAEAFLINPEQQQQQQLSQPEVTEPIFYDDLTHTEQYHFDDTTEVFPETHDMNKEPPIAVKMFQFHRSRSPVSWSFKPKA